MRPIDNKTLRLSDHIVGVLAHGPKTGGELVRECLPEFAPSEVSKVLTEMVLREMILIGKDKLYKLNRSR